MLSFGGLGFGSFTGSFAVIDATEPSLVSAVINAAGDELLLTYSETLDATSEPASSAYSLDGTASAPTGTPNVGGATVAIPLDPPVFEGEVVTLDYTPPGSGKVRDLALNNAAALTGQAVTNNSEVPPEVTELIETLTLATDAFAEGFATVSLLRGSDPITDPATGDQFFAYHADNPPSILSGKVALGKITPANVVTVDKSAITSDAQDSHNFFSMMVDGDGDLLISGDMHGVAMKWQRLTGGSIDLTAWATPPIEAGATDEASVTYPFFVRLPNGDALFTYRDGGSGDGKLVLKRWSRTAHTLTLVAVIVDGNVDGKSFYPHVPYWDTVRGRLHCGGCWRDTTALNTNHDQIHFWLESSDNWVTCTAKNAGGSAQTLPVTVANAAYASNDATNTGLTNVGSITIGSDGHPRMFSFSDPGDGITQLFALRYTGAAWVRSLVPDHVELRSGIPFSYVGVTTSAPRTAISSPRAICNGTSDRTIILMRSDTQGTGVWALVSEQADLTQWTWRLLDAGNVGWWFGGQDELKWRNDGEIHTLIQRCKFEDEATIGPQTLRRLRFRPKSASYTYTPPAALFNPNDYAGCIGYIAPRVGGVKVKGGAVTADIERLADVLDARDGSTFFVQATTADAPKLVWNHFGTRRGGILAISANADFMRCTAAGKLAALTGIDVPLVMIAVVQFTNVTAAQCYFGAGVTSDSTRYLRIGITAAGLPTFERRVGGAAVKQYTGSSGALVAGTKYVITSVFDGSTGYMRVNGVQQGAAVDMAFAGATFTPSQLALCHRWRGASNDLYFDGHLGAMPIWTTVPSAGDIIAIENALAAEHAITF